MKCESSKNRGVSGEQGTWMPEGSGGKPGGLKSKDKRSGVATEVPTS